MAEQYRIEVTRRKQSEHNYARQPFSASAFLGKRLVAVQYGRSPVAAFTRALAAVDEDRQRVPVVVDL